jgi:enterochelin esterase-like enzyme
MISQFQLNLVRVTGFRLLAAVILLILLGASCQSKPVPVSDALRANTPTPTAPCDIVEDLAPKRPTIPRPAVIAMPTITPESRFAGAQSDLVDARFYSQLISKEMPLLVYLPPGYSDSSRRYPVLYMLSGYAGDYREWATYGLCRVLDILVRGGQVQPMILVMPEGEKSWWFNHAPAPGSDGKPWGDYVWRDLVGYVDANYRTLPRPASRAVGGLSSGGQSALMLALTRPEVFGIVGAHSPSTRGADGSLAIFGDREYFKQYDPIWLFQNTTTWKRLAIWIDIGAEDTQWGNAIKDLHATLVKSNIPHDFQNSWRGVHDSNYWAEHLSDYLMWYGSKLQGE